MNEKLYPIVILIFIMLISIILAFADDIDGNVKIVQLEAQQERQADHFLARQNDYYAKAVRMLDDNNNNALQGLK